MDNFEKSMPEMPKVPEKAEPMVTPVEKVEFSDLTESVEEKPKSKSGANIFMAVLISVVIIVLLSVAGWFLGRKYIWQPQQSYVENQFKTLDLKIQDLNAELEAERIAAEDTMEVLKEMETLLEDMKAVEEPIEIGTGETWQNYSDKNWGINFQYPADWEVNEMETEGDSYLVITSKDTQELLDAKQIFPGYPYNIEIHRYADFAEFALAKNVKGEYFLDFPFMNKSGNIEFIAMADEIVPNSFSYLENGYGSIYCLVLEVNGVIYDFRMGRGGEKLQENEEMVLKTLKFTK